MRLDQRVRARLPHHWHHGQFSLIEAPPIREQILDGIITDENGCWIWQNAISSEGYGKISSQYTHRLSFEEFAGPIPDGLTIDHLCRVRACCNPEHLEPVTLRENIRRSHGPSGINARRTHCIRGHEFTKANTRVTRGGKGRQCLTCQKGKLYGTPL